MLLLCNVSRLFLQGQLLKHNTDPTFTIAYKKITCTQHGRLLSARHLLVTLEILALPRPSEPYRTLICPSYPDPHSAQTLLQVVRGGLGLGVGAGRPNAQLLSHAISLAAALSLESPFKQLDGAEPGNEPAEESRP